jgi:hypothetical protein
MRAQAMQLFPDPPQTERLSLVGEFDGVPAFELDVPETIPALGYGSHQFFRYYGKFPSVVGKEIVRRHSRPHEAVLDSYAGSGTTLVEAQIAGRPSFGLDLNPLAVLASGVKTGYYDTNELRALRKELEVEVQASDARLPQVQGWSAEKLRKWFRHEAQLELAQLRNCLLARSNGPTRAFLIAAFLAIVRRTSNAYDGEVRPHVNPEKRPRSPIAAFFRKLDEMIRGLGDLDSRRPPGVPSASAIGDNRDSTTFASLLGQTRAGLLVAHPPLPQLVQLLASVQPGVLLGTRL